MYSLSIKEGFKEKEKERVRVFGIKQKGKIWKIVKRLKPTRFYTQGIKHPNG
jgi:hypothetical protein